jgi:hypothetical protein
MGKLLAAAGAVLASSFLIEVALPSLVPPRGMVLPAAAAEPASLLLAGGPPGAVRGLGAIRPLFADVPTGGYPHDTYAWGNCTWWAAYNQVVPPYLGDAWRWLAGASAAGLPTAVQPSVGAVVVYRASPGYDVVHGHVAIVIAVGPSSFLVSEMNYVGLGAVDERDSPWPDWHVEGFIPR